MFKVFVFSLAVVLVVSSQSFGGISQNQGFGIQSTTLAELFKGTGTIGDGKIAVVSLGQTNIGSCLWAIQDDNVIFTQRATAVGQCAHLGVMQNGSAIGGQFQSLAGFSGPKAQGQELELGLAQEVTKTNGAGTAAASHEFIGDRLQTLGSSSGSLSQSNFVNVAQNAGIRSAPCTDVMVAGGMYLAVSQTQAVN